MTKRCTLKEAFIEKLLDKFQPDWKNGEDITAETKQHIKDYVSAKMPEGLKEEAECITDYSIWHMAKKIRERENLSSPRKSNKGPKVSICQSEESDNTNEIACELADIMRELIALFCYNAVIQAIESIRVESSILVKMKNEVESSINIG